MCYLYYIQFYYLQKLLLQSPFVAICIDTGACFALHCLDLIASVE
jgi:hypothetical protein